MARRTTEEPQGEPRRQRRYGAWAEGPTRPTRRTSCRSTLEPDPAAARPIAGPRQAQRPAGLRSGAAGNMSPSVYDVINCLQKYNETSSRGSRRKATHSLSKHRQCAEDPNISGTRVDAYVETPTEKCPPEAKLCMSSGATLGTAQKSRTLKLGIQQAALPVPQQHLSTAERLLKDYIVQKSTDVQIKRLGVRAPPRTSYTCSKKYKVLHDLYIATESKIAVLAI